MAWKKREPMKPQVALEKLEALCAGAEYCRGELQQKLFNWGVPSGDAQHILVSLAERHFFDDRRFAGVFCRQKLLYSRWGKRKVIMALREKRVAADVIADALQEIPDEEYHKAMHQTLMAKARLIREGNTYDGRTKLFRFGVQRGYEPSLVTKEISHGNLWPSETEDDASEP